MTKSRSPTLDGLVIGLRLLVFLRSLPRSVLSVREMLPLWGATPGVSGLTFWEHVLVLGDGQLERGFSARAHGVRRVVVYAPHGAAAQSRRLAARGRWR